MTTELNLENVSRETLEKALQAVFAYAEPLAPDEDPSWHTICPSRADNGNIDDVWEAGQNNGEAYTATSVCGLIAKTLREGSEQ